MIEEWRPVVGYEDRYQISNLGNLKSNDITIHYKNGKTEFRKGVLRKANIVNGYRCFLMTSKTGGKRRIMSAHRMVAMAFIPNPYNKPCVDHIDTNPLNDCVTNLRWVTYSENNRNPITMTKYRKPGEYSHSVETKIKIGIKSKGRKWTKTQLEKQKAKGWPILMFDKAGIFLKEFASSSYAQEEMGIHRTHIYDCCNGKRKSAGGYKWSYKER